jgi:hypothetical protein
MKSKELESAFLVGPFVGEFWWECFHFAPYIIHLKRKHPHRKIIVFTRPARFDLYGGYADILLPLRVEDDDSRLQRCFKSRRVSQVYYSTLVNTFYDKYVSRFNIIKHIYPDTSLFFYKIKWQFPRPLMNYSFRPRRKNSYLVGEFVKSGDILIDSVVGIIQQRGMKRLSDVIFNVSHLLDDKESSFMGCVIESIKICRAVVGNLKSDISKLALLLKKPLISIDEKLTDDQIHLINPYDTPVIRALSVEEGLDIYESNF